MLAWMLLKTSPGFPRSCSYSPEHLLPLVVQLIAVRYYAKLHFLSISQVPVGVTLTLSKTLGALTLVSEAAVESGTAVGGASYDVQQLKRKRRPIYPRRPSHRNTSLRRPETADEEAEIIALMLQASGDPDLEEAIRLALQVEQEDYNEQYA